MYINADSKGSPTNLSDFLTSWVTTVVTKMFIQVDNAFNHKLAETVYINPSIRIEP